MKFIKDLLLLLIMIDLASCNIFITQNKIEKEAAPIYYWDPPTPLVDQGISSSYPYGRVFRKHQNSISWNTEPDYSSTLFTPINNGPRTSQARRVEKPDYADLSTYTDILYFDSNAEDGGDGSFNYPHNNLDGITHGSLLKDSRAYLLKADSVFLDSAIGLRYDAPKKYVYFGSYGEGAMPIICNAADLENPTNSAGDFWLFGEQIAIDGLHLIRCDGGSYSRLLNMGGKHISIANSHIEGIKAQNGRYPTYGINGGAEYLTIYNSEFSFVRMDLFILSANNRHYQFVSNYFHHANVGCYEGKENEDGVFIPYDPEDRETWIYRTGDTIQFESGTPKDSYFADNVFDRGDTPGKFCFIINGNTSLAETEGTLIEYNTFISPLASFGGAGAYIYSHVLLRKNLFLNTDPEGVVSALASGSGYGQNYTENHFVNYNGSETYNFNWNHLGMGNRKYSTLSDYKEEVALEDRMGSSLF